MEDDTVRELREAIAVTDRALLDALNRRLELVDRLKKYKASQGIEFVDRAREQLNLDRLADENAGSLSQEGLASFYRSVLELTKRELDR